MEYKVTAQEESIDCHGLPFICVYGLLVNSGFVAFINWGVSAELGTNKNSLAYNRSKILESLERSHYSAWLPSDEETRSRIALDLAMVIGERISKMQGV